MQGDTTTRSRDWRMRPPRSQSDAVEAFDDDTPNQGVKVMAFVFGKQPAALMLGAGALALAVGAASAAPLVKECGKNGNFVIGFCQAEEAYACRQNVDDVLYLVAQ